MAYKRMTDLSADTVVALGVGEDQQKSIEGYYLGAREVTTTNGPSNIHVFQTAKGNVGVWGTKKLNDNLGSGNRGTMTLVTYKAKVKLQGGKTQHTYDFMVDPDNTIDVATLPQGNAPLEQDTDSVRTDDIPPDQAARTARVQALFNGK